MGRSLDARAGFVTVAALAALGAGLIIPSTAVEASPDRIEAEDAFLHECSEKANAVLNHAGASGGQVLRFSASGCSADYASALMRISQARWTGTGNFGATVCGSWEIWQLFLFVDASDVRCTVNPTFVTASFQPQLLVPGPFTVAWRTAPGTPDFANGLLDFVDHA
jgi:hypothetical protein